MVNYIKLYYDKLNHFKFQQPSTHFYTFTERVIYYCSKNITKLLRICIPLRQNL